MLPSQRPAPRGRARKDKLTPHPSAVTAGPTTRVSPAPLQRLPQAPIIRLPRADFPASSMDAPGYYEDYVDPQDTSARRQRLPQAPIIRSPFAELPSTSTNDYPAAYDHLVVNGPPLPVDDIRWPSSNAPLQTFDPPEANFDMDLDDGVNAVLRRDARLNKKNFEREMAPEKLPTEFRVGRITFAPGTLFHTGKRNPERYDRNDVKLNPKIFQLAKKTLQFKPSVDLFASKEHHQLPRYYSQTPDPRAVGTDAFVADWKLEQALYINPPWYRIPECLKRLKKDGLKAMFVAPYWKTVDWWPLFEELCVKYIIFNTPVYLLPDGSVRDKPTWDTVIGLLDGEKGKRYPAREIVIKSQAIPVN